MTNTFYFKPGDVVSLLIDIDAWEDEPKALDVGDIGTVITPKMNPEFVIVRFGAEHYETLHVSNIRLVPDEELLS
jgi:hypothetical protein